MTPPPDEWSDEDSVDEDSVDDDSIDDDSAEGPVVGPGQAADGSPPLELSEDDLSLERDLVPTLDGRRLTSRGTSSGAATYTTEDGAPIDSSRESEIVFLNPRAGVESELEPEVLLREGALVSGDWWSAAGLSGGLFLDEPAKVVRIGSEEFDEGDVASLLTAVGSNFVPPARPEASPLSLHRALLAWNGPVEPFDDDPTDDDTEVEDTFIESDAHSEAEMDRLAYGFWKALLRPAGEVDAPLPDGASAWAAEVYWGEAERPASYRYWVRLAPDGAVTGAGWLDRPPPLGEAPSEDGQRSPAFRDVALDESTLASVFATFEEE